MLSQKPMQSCTYGIRRKRRLVWFGHFLMDLECAHCCCLIDACIVMPGCSESGTHIAISLFMLHDLTNQLDVVSLIFWKSVAMKAGYNRDGELPCINPTSKSGITGFRPLLSYFRSQITKWRFSSKSTSPVLRLRCGIAMTDCVENERNL
jgi:hypothetical protein